MEPRLAGVLSAFPLGAAIVLYFLGLENGPAFVAEAAVYATAGLGAALVLVFAYHHAIRLFPRHDRWFAPLAGVAGFLSAAAVLKPFSFNLTAAVAVPVVTAVVLAARFRPIGNAARPIREPLKLQAHAGRAALTTLMVLLITGIAAAVGPSWAGLFAAFPVSMFPFLIIMHLTYGPDHARTIVKNFNLGIGALVTYMAVAALAYPRWGVNPGTLAALASAVVYLFLFSQFRRYLQPGEEKGIPGG
ncbi:MAG: hypothetical protein ABFS45_03275 [Pseudomonadota bacterium]